MRLMAIIGAVLTLALSVWPCADEPAHEVAGGLVAVGCADGQDPQQAAHHDHCTPFCLCHCCHTHVTPTESLALGQFEAYSQPTGQTTQALYHRHTFSIWNPPRVVA